VNDAAGSSEADCRGEGRGAITRDGCAVELYLKLPYRGELELIGDRLRAGFSVLELGCGTGRITRALLERGHDVTAVDNSDEMLGHVPARAHKVRSDIEALALGRRFDIVLLASNLINTPDEPLRAAQLSVCREHLEEGGLLVFERFDPHWLRSAEAGFRRPVGDCEIAVDQVRRANTRVRLSLSYSTAGETWRQHFTAAILEDDDVQRVLREARFGRVEWIDRRWGVASV
jgi:SAM-dependent methyltransferase